jgi:hypothetical protein
MNVVGEIELLALSIELNENLAEPLKTVRPFLIPTPFPLGYRDSKGGLCTL